MDPGLFQQWVVFVGSVLQGQQLLHVHGTDGVQAAEEELIVADLVHLLRGVEGVPEH